MSVQPLNSPFTGGPARLIETTETIEFRGQHFDVTAPCYEDENGEQFTTDEQDQVFLDELHRLWRERNGVPSAEQLRERRGKIGLSAAETTALLGVGANVYRQYEQGDLPSESNSRILKLFCDPTPAVLAGLVRAAGTAISARTQRKIAAFLREVEKLTVFVPDAASLDEEAFLSDYLINSKGVVYQQAVPAAWANSPYLIETAVGTEVHAEELATIAFDTHG